MHTLNEAGPRIDLSGTQCVGLRIPDISEPIQLRTAGDHACSS